MGHSVESIGDTYNSMTETMQVRATELQDTIATEAIASMTTASHAGLKALDEGRIRGEVREAINAKALEVDKKYQERRVKHIEMLENQLEKVASSYESLQLKQHGGGQQAAKLREYEIAAGAASDEGLEGRINKIKTVNDGELLGIDHREVETIAYELRRRGKAKDADSFIKSMEKRQYREPYKNMDEWTETKRKIDFFSEPHPGHVRVWPGYEVSLRDMVKMPSRKQR